MLLSIPLTIMVKIDLENDDDTRWIGVMLGGGDHSGKEEIPIAELPEQENKE